MEPHPKTDPAKTRVFWLELSLHWWYNERGGVNEALGQMASDEAVRPGDQDGCALNRFHGIL